jgi:GMP synthase (glutamine-hydrolysing)
MRVLAYRHVPFEGLGRVADSLVARGIQFEYADLYVAGATPPDSSGYAGLIFLGGPMSVNDDFPWLKEEMDVIRRAVAAGQPVLGICLGAQLIAKALGAGVRRNPASEIGWYPISCTAAAQSDRLFRGLESETVFHWHSETLNLPDGAELLASSELCRNQAFRIGERIYGLQFHLEVTPEMIDDWCRQDENCGDVCELPEPLDARRNSSRLEALADTIFGRWCDMLGAMRAGTAHVGKVVPEFSVE